MAGTNQYSTLSGTCLYSWDFLPSFYVAVRQAVSMDVERWLLEIPGIDSYTVISIRECPFSPKVPGKVSTLNHWPSWVICPTLRLSLYSNNEIPNWPDMVPWVGVNCTQITWIESGERWLPKEIMELSLEEGGLDLGQ